MGAELNRFVENTVEYLEHNRDLLDDDLELPDLGQDWTGRHVLIVVRGSDYSEDLGLLRQTGYLREMRPVLVGGRRRRRRPARRGPDPRRDHRRLGLGVRGRAALRRRSSWCTPTATVGRPGAERLEELGLDHLLFRASGTSEDIAMLLAFELGAELIVAVGTHTSMVDFLDKGRAGMASTIVTRMKVGPILVDAKGVSRLYQRRVRKRDLLLLVAAAMFAMVRRHPHQRAHPAAHPRQLGAPDRHRRSPSP